MSNIGPKLREMRLRAGLGLQDASAGICSPSYLSLVETGKRPATERLVSALSSKYDVNLQDALTFDEMSTLLVVRSAIASGDQSLAAELVRSLPSKALLELGEALLLEGRGFLSESIERLEKLIESQNLDALSALVAADSIVRQLRAIGHQDRALNFGERFLDTNPLPVAAAADLDSSIRGNLATCALELGRYVRTVDSGNTIDAPPTSKARLNLLWKEATAAHSSAQPAKALELFREATNLACLLGQETTAAKLKLMRIWILFDGDFDQQQSARDELASFEPALGESSNTELSATYAALKIRAQNLGGAFGSHIPALETFEMLKPMLPFTLAMKLESHVAESLALGGLVKMAGDLLKACKSQMLIETRVTGLTEVWRRVASGFEVLGDKDEALFALKMAVGSSQISSSRLAGI